jgi:retron-type reverse transcriptase
VTFKIYEPKERVISAAPFRDRVVHHTLMNIIGPILEKHFIFHTFANRKGKGVHAAIEILKHKLQNPDIKFVLKCDIKKYFPSIDIQILIAKLKKRIKCQKTLDLMQSF